MLAIYIFAGLCLIIALITGIGGIIFGLREFLKLRRRKYTRSPEDTIPFILIMISLQTSTFFALLTMVSIFVNINNPIYGDLALTSGELTLALKSKTKSQ